MPPPGVLLVVLVGAVARIRTIKPEFFRHRELQDLAKKHGAEVMLVYIGLWTQCDKAGNFLWDEDQLALDILPFLGIKIRKSLEVLETSKYILRYFDGKTFGHIPTFKQHQLIFGSERSYPCKYPEPKDLDSLYTQGNTVVEPRILELGVRNNGIMEKGNNGKVASPSFLEHPWFSDSQFLKEWTAWGNERRKAGTERNFATLLGLAGDDLALATRIVAASADNGWKGLFPLKDGQSRPKSNSRQKNMEREYDEHLTL